MARKRTKKTVIKSCEDLATQIVMERCNGICEIGKAKNCTVLPMRTPHHVIRRSQSTRLLWVPDNLLATCNACHAWWHNNEVEAGIWFCLTYPDRWLEIDYQKQIKETLRLSYWENLETELLAMTVQEGTDG